ncbi:MAG: hypothetical protein ACYTEQ_15840 [Planctomycetota bacterium]
MDSCLRRNDKVWIMQWVRDGDDFEQDGAVNYVDLALFDGCYIEVVKD